MDWVKESEAYIQTVKPVEINTPLISKILSLIDLTSLNETDSEATIAALCNKAYTPFGHVAGICTYPQFVPLTATQFAGSPIKVATVANFPYGSASLDTALLEINRALQDGVQEIDLVVPYSRYLSGDREYVRNYVASCKAACGDNVILKVILETAVLNDLDMVASASKDVLEAGADFIKTSTGKIAQGATPETAATMLLVIRELEPKLGRTLGFKASGGIKELQQAAQYIELADNIMGPRWISPKTFRLGASKLVDEILSLDRIK